MGVVKLLGAVLAAMLVAAAPAAAAGAEPYRPDLLCDSPQLLAAAPLPSAAPCVDPGPRPWCRYVLWQPSLATPGTDCGRRAATALAAGGARAARPKLAAVRDRRINIDPGHNGANTGAFNGQVPSATRRLIDAGIPLASPQCDTSGTATYGGYAEHAFTLDVALRLRTILRQAGAKVTMTRTSDDGPMGPCTFRRAAIGNGAEVAISIHADGGDGGRGFHVIYPTSLRGYTDDIARPSYALALAIRDAMRTTGMPDSTYVGRNGLNGRQNLVGLLLSNVPKVFLEAGAMHTASDARLLGSPAFRQRMAQALAVGLNRWFARR